jgi:hypothetical protein
MIYNKDLSKYYRSGEGWIDTPEKASRYSKENAEFVMGLFKEPHAGEPELYELEVHSYQVFKMEGLKKVASN